MRSPSSGRAAPRTDSVAAGASGRTTSEADARCVGFVVSGPTAPDVMEGPKPANSADRGPDPRQECHTGTDGLDLPRPLADTRVAATAQAHADRQQPGGHDDRD